MATIPRTGERRRAQDTTVKISPYNPGRLAGRLLRSAGSKRDAEKVFSAGARGFSREAQDTG